MSFAIDRRHPGPSAGPAGRPPPFQRRPHARRVDGAPRRLRSSPVGVDVTGPHPAPDLAPSGRAGSSSTPAARPCSPGAVRGRSAEPALPGPRRRLLRVAPEEEGAAPRRPMGAWKDAVEDGAREPLGVSDGLCRQTDSWPGQGEKDSGRGVHRWPVPLPSPARVRVWRLGCPPAHRLAPQWTRSARAPARPRKPLRWLSCFRAHRRRAWLPTGP